VGSTATSILFPSKDYIESIAYMSLLAPDIFRSDSVQMIDNWHTTATRPSHSFPMSQIKTQYQLLLEHHHIPSLPLHGATSTRKGGRLKHQKSLLLIIKQKCSNFVIATWNVIQSPQWNLVYETSKKWLQHSVLLQLHMSKSIFATFNFVVS
jgi:hypothetical protein